MVLTMKKLALVYALLLAASPAAAQLATSSSLQRLNGPGVQTTAVEPHRLAFSASSGGAGAVSLSIPPCSSEPPFNELCN